MPNELLDFASEYAKRPVINRGAEQYKGAEAPWGFVIWSTIRGAFSI